MSLNTALSQWSHRFLGIGDDSRLIALELLRQRYVDENQHAERFKQHARQMKYPQFREKLLHIAADEAKHAEWIAEKIVALGGTLPKAPERPSTDENSWQHLLKDLEEESRCAGDLMEQIWSMQSNHPDIAEVLQRISEEENKHRDEIREMLMRSDAFALSLA